MQAAPQPQNLKPLTALRFFAAMWVVSYDFWPSLGAPTPRVVAKGYLGVELFFVLSGFILSHVYLQSFGERRFGYVKFLWARLARIYPLHLATLIGIGALAVGAAVIGADAGSKVLVWSSLPAQLTLTQAWGLGLGGGWNHPSWSISAEWFAYLAFPLFAWTAWRLKGRPMLGLGLALAFVCAMELGFERWAGFPLTEATIAWGALRIVPCFALGCATYLVWRARPLSSAPVALAVCAAAVLAIVAAAEAGWPDWIAIDLFAALIFGLASLPVSGSRALSWGVWVYLGEVSFAIYMVCIPWKLAFENLAARAFALGDGPLPLGLWLADALGVIPAAMVLHHLIERPAREAMRRRGPLFLGGGR
ncbi:MAG: acyltransferase family protein [Caulobacteraceae bacterium]